MVAEFEEARKPKKKKSVKASAAAALMATVMTMAGVRPARTAEQVDKDRLAVEQLSSMLLLGTG